WRSTARHGSLVVREFEQPRRPLILLRLDNAQSFGTGRQSTLEVAIKLAATLGAWALGAGYSVTLADRERLTHCGTPMELRRRLAHLKIAPVVGWPSASEAPGAEVLLLTGGTDLGTAAGRRNVPLVTVAPALFPGQPPIDPGSADLVIRPASDIAAAAGQVAALVAGLLAGSRAMGMPR
ncbi:MAG TPA: DUF58 domain-containing protein, partial [Chloroflexota bacterium]|nr:DUF58 domain-containing protein [Chloroflexota bacterium]